MTAMSIAGIGLKSFAIAFAVVVLVVFAKNLMREGWNPQRAADRTARGFKAVVMGSVSAIVAVAVVGVELLLSYPELVITALGVGAITAGVSWEVFGATALTTYIVGAAVTGDY